ncbi:PAS domain S-box protein [Tistrella sp. BH-R2-4]|uniref:histidine kinase n=1 Tax=Tistrella arctica TaxID=3133430 RepID=A0ABU9YMU6_9PROT
MFAEIIDATHDAIVVIDAQGIVQFANRATELMFGYSPAELIGSNISRLMRDEEAASHDRYLEDADPNLQRRIIGRGRQLTARRRDGSIIPIDLVVSPLPRTTIRMYIGTIRDLSDRKLAEESLRLSFESAGVGQAIVGMDGRFLKVNAALARSLGREAGSMTGTHFREVIHPADVTAPENWLAAGGRISETMEATRRYIHADGHTVWFRVASVIIRNRDGDPAHCIAQFADVTALMKTEQRLTGALAAAESASAAKTAFLAHMNHELRTPLNAVIGFAELLLSGLHGPLDPRHCDHVSAILQAGRRLLTIVDDILDLTRLDDPSLLDSQEVDIDQIVAEGLQRAAEAEGRGDVKITVTIAPETTLAGDPAATARIIANLASNAIKFSRPGGQVQIIAESHDDNGRTGVLIRVIDDGIGMPETLARQLGQPFAVGGGVLSRSHGGAGLGLAIVRRLVTLIGGRINFSTAPGQGTEVTVDLPDTPLQSDTPMRPAVAD